MYRIKQLVIILIIISAMLMVCGCSHTDNDRNYSREYCIVTTVFPAYDFAMQLSGSHAEVILLVPPGSETHSYEPTPSDIILIQSADLIICNGGESEAWLETIFDGIDTELPVLKMMDCVPTIEEEIKEGMQHVAEEENGDETEYDEHVWTSPVNAQLICEQITQRLISIDASNEKEYISLCNSYLAQLKELDEEFRIAVKDGMFSTLIFADRFPVRYFVEEYGLDYYAAFAGCADDAEPSAKTVAFLIDRVNEEKIPAVLYIEFSNQKMADVICEDTGCKKMLFHSCHNVSSDDLRDGVTYIQLMQQNIITVREALGSGSTAVQ